MQVHNRDVFPTPETKALFSVVNPLIQNSRVDAPFQKHEDAAKEAKEKFHKWGRLGMILVLVSVLFTVAERLTIPPFPGIEIVDIAFVVLGIIGLAIQVWLLATEKKQDWLLSRFAAERLRSIKFQAYSVALLATSLQDLEVMANHFYDREVDRLNNELNVGYAALLNFSPAKALDGIGVGAGQPGNQALLGKAREAYAELRIAYQRRFAQGEITLLGQKQRLGYTASDILYLSGVTLSIATLSSKLLFPTATGILSWIDFLAVSAFVLGLVYTIMDNASLAETSKIRYEDYVRLLDECEAELKSEHAPFPDVIRRIERVVLGELSDFCQSAVRISYRL